MLRKYLFLAVSLLFVGCLAIVDESAQGKKVKSFVITKEEALDILQKAQNKPPEEKYEIKLFRLNR